MKTYFQPDLEMKTWAALLFFAIILLSWFVISRTTAQAKIPRAQRFQFFIFHYSLITFIVFLGLITVKIVFKLTSIPVQLIVINASAVFIVTLVFRLFTFKVMKASRSSESNTQWVLIIADSFSDGFIHNLMIQKEWGYRIQSIVSDSKLIIAKYGALFQIHPCDVNFKKVIDQGIVDEVIYCKRNVEIDLIRKVANHCNEIGIIFRMQSSVSPLDPADFQLKTFSNRMDLSIVDSPSTSISLVLKTIMDIYFSILALIILIPFFVIIAALIKMSSKGPIFFKQERIGRRGRKFTLYKFRTMVPYSENEYNRLKAMNEANGPVFKIKHDPRITRIGRVLRKTGLDELPQLYNVIKGEMSLIGPRPPLKEEVVQYERWQLRRLSVKPGITCSWQIFPGRHDVPFNDWMKLDLKYIDNWNLSKDLVLFIKTIGTFFRAGGH